MSITTSKSNVISSKGFALVAALICAFALSLSIAAAPAYAEGDSTAAAGESASAAAIDPTVGAAPASEANANNGSTPAVEGATTFATSENAASENGLSAAAGPASYPGDDKSDDIFIGLTPVKTDTEATAPYGDLPADATITPSTNGNAVYVGITSKVGQGVDLAVAVDYVRVNANTYGEGDTAVLPLTLSSGNTSQNASDFFVINWYYGDSPLDQGAYYSNLQEYLNMTGASSAGSAQPLPTVNHNSVPTAIDARAFHYGATRNGYSNGSWNVYPGIPFPSYDRFKIDPQNSAKAASSGLSLPIGSTSTAKACERALHYEANHRDRKIILFFETSGTRVITAQATFLREVVNGSNVSHIVYASVPVVFYIDVQSANQGTFTVNGQKENGDPVDIQAFYNATGEATNFETVLYKKYKHLDDYTEDSAGSLYNYEGLENYVPLWEGNSHETYAAAGTYKIIAESKNNLYEPLVATFTVSDAEFKNNATVTRTATLHPVGTVKQYKARFVDEDGKTVILREASYDKDTPGSSVEKPSTTPTKAKDATAYYVFDYWTVVEKGYGTLEPLDVTDDYTYKAHYKTISKTDTTSAGGVGASGGLFNISDADKASKGIASYELAVNPISSTATSVTSNMSIIGSNNSVLGAYEVDITQHNVDGTTAKVTTDVGALTLEFPVSGVADGTTVQIIQVHASTGANDPAKTIKHTGVVNNGKVSVTVPNKLSTFIVATNLEPQGTEEGSQGDQGSSPGDPSGDTPSGNTSDDPAASDPKGEVPNQESGTLEEGADPETTNEDNSVTRGMPAADQEVGVGGLNDDGRGDDVVTEGVKAAPGADENTMPETGDAHRSPLPYVLTALAAVVAAVAFGARRRENER